MLAGLLRIVLIFIGFLLLKRWIGALLGRGSSRAPEDQQVHTRESSSSTVKTDQPIEEAEYEELD